MISKSVLRLVIADQLKELDSLADSVPRTIFSQAASYNAASALIVKGIRRCGKSTLLKQLLKAKHGTGFYYFNFDDERILEFKAEDFQPLMETLAQAQGEKKIVLFDEIQNITGWELFVNRLLRQGVKAFITGSNANLLSKELGTHLTGRHVDLELYPFSFAEFLCAKKIEAPKNGFYSTQQKADLSNAFKEYLLKGGMPEAIVFSNDGVLASVFNDIIQKDILGRHAIRKPNELKAVLKFLVANAANPSTFRSIRNNFSIKSPNTVQKYVESAQEAYLVFSVQKFERKAKKFDKNPKKIYCMDNGIITRNAPGIAERKGALLENSVAIELKRRGLEFYYFKGETGAEADFVVPAQKTAIQVCYELTEENKERELKGLLDSMQETSAQTGLILTLEQEREITAKNKKITVKPAWQWMLETNFN